jgi:hypothetical protein
LLADGPGGGWQAGCRRGGGRIGGLQRRSPGGSPAKHDIWHRRRQAVTRYACWACTTCHGRRGTGEMSGYAGRRRGLAGGRARSGWRPCRPVETPERSERGGGAARPDDGGLRARGPCRAPRGATRAPEVNRLGERPASARTLDASSLRHEWMGNRRGERAKRALVTREPARRARSAGSLPA